MEDLASILKTIVWVVCQIAMTAVCIANSKIMSRGVAAFSIHSGTISLLLVQNIHVINTLKVTASFLN